IPGGIDPHVHTHWPIPALGGGLMTSAPPEQVSRAAIFGGTTTLVDFAVWEPGLTIARAIDQKEAVWRQGYTDYGLHVKLQCDVRGHLVPPRAASGALRRGRRGVLRARERRRGRRGHRRGARRGARHLRRDAAPLRDLHRRRLPAARRRSLPHLSLAQARGG